MKISAIFGVFSLASWSVFAAEEAAASANSGSAAAPNLDFKVTYEITGHPESQVYRLFNEEEIALKYSFTNNDETDITILGCGGAFKNPDTLKPIVNLTDAALGPLAVETDKEVSFVQKVGIDISPEPYVLAPVVYVSYNDVVYVITPTPKFVVVEDRPISFFDPQLLLALTILISIFGAIGYFVVTQFVLPYINNNYLKKNTQKPVKTPATAAPTKKTSTSATGVSKKSYDESWLPQGHLKKQNRKK